MLKSKQFARMGEFYLEEAILDVLLEAEYEDHCMGAASISRQAGIFRERGVQNIMNDAIAMGILHKLSDQGGVERCKQTNRARGGWELTEEEFEKRREDIALGN